MRAKKQHRVRPPPPSKKRKMSEKYREYIHVWPWASIVYLLSSQKARPLHLSLVLSIFLSLSLTLRVLSPVSLLSPSSKALSLNKEAQQGGVFLHVLPFWWQMTHMQYKMSH